MIIGAVGTSPAAVFKYEIEKEFRSISLALAYVCNLEERHEVLRGQHQQRGSTMFRSILSFAMVCVASNTVHAAVVLDNLSEPFCCGINGGFDNWFGIEFTTDGSNYTLDDATVDIVNNSPATSFFTAVYTDSSGAPGALLETLSGSTNPATGLATYTSAGLSLSANTTYWFVMGHSNGTDTGEIRWSQTSTDSSAGPWALGNQTDRSQNQGASWGGFSGEEGYLRLNATVAVESSGTPEPSTLMLAGLGLLGLATKRRRRCQPYYSSLQGRVWERE